MDRPVKERLIGAVVLVTVAWLLIPVFLDAPSDEPAGDDSWVTLPRADDDGAPTVPTRRETIVLQEPRSEPEATTVAVETLPTPVLTGQPKPRDADAQDAAASPVDEVDAPEPVVSEPDEQDASSPSQSVADVTEEPPADDVQPTAPAPSPPQPAQSAANAASGAQMWAVQLGSFSNEDNAQRLAAEYRANGLLAFVSKVEQGGRTLHRVRIGPETDRSVSDAIVTRLTKDGQAARTVPHP